MSVIMGVKVTIKKYNIKNVEKCRLKTKKKNAK